MTAMSGVALWASPASAADPCNPLINAIACENSKPGNPATEWGISGAGDGTIQGFATDISVNAGSAIGFKIKSPANYTIDVYRLGYYQGNGARKITSLTPNVPQSQTQPACLVNSTTNEVDCGNWHTSATWNVPSTAVSGVYLLHLIRTDTGGESQVYFVVRNDSSRAALLFQTSDETWQAYNQWGGWSLYTGATKVSYNRPLDNRDTSVDAGESVFHNEYPMIRFLEQNGYDMSYQAGVDTDRLGTGILLNHKVFMSVGHDEYWSGNQRANVEAARNAGVNLAFFSGNEVFWKTRWENSIDGTNTAYRTLVTYKETHANAVTDPADPPTWTGTWRDPRFSPPADGGRPENALTGTIWMVQNAGAILSIQVPQADGMMRIWRNTSIANLLPGQTATLTAGTLGYEWDEDLDNGFRPAGLIDLSTTTQSTPQVLQDFGSTVAPGTATHHMTLYKASSGALVFSAGTIDFSWGLDSEHDGEGGGAADSRLQQATVNLLADMSAQPGTLMAGLVSASKTTDVTPPTTTITSPASGAQIADGSTVTITGTASDTGGQVGGVEVSTDNGATWHPATGRSSWTYTWNVASFGSTTIKVRAADDSGNIQTATTSRVVTVNCPCGIYPNAAVPATPATSDTSAVELGVKFTSDVSGWVTGVSFYKGAGNTGTHTGTLWTAAGAQLATGTFTNETTTGWQTLTFANAVPISAGVTYVASYHTATGRYAADQWALLSAEDSPPLHALANAASGGNGVYLAGAGGFPTNTFGATSYGVDVQFTNVAPPDNTPPTVVTQAPLAGSSSNPTSSTVQATFSEPVQSATISFVLKDPSNVTVPATVAYNGATNTATLTPTSALAPGATYTATASGAKDLAGNAMAAASTWSFKTAVSANPPGVCPCSIWTDATQPATPASTDPGAVEIGVKFTSDLNGTVTGVRFYKGATNTGTHTGSLWNLAGTRLATGTFTGETTAGWQTLTFTTPVPITAGTTYVASYLAPNGHYAVDGGFFSSAGVNNAPMHAVADTTSPNGVYKYGGGFPNSSFGASNYWVDVVFGTPPDTTPPIVSSTEPGPAATSVPVGGSVRATFSEPVQPATVSFTLKTAANVAVAGGVSYDAPSNTATFTPSAPLTAGAVYNASISGAKDTAGNTMTTPLNWSFTTSGPTACPCSVFSSSTTPALPATTDPSAIELGMKFKSDVNGTVTGVRFYKGTGNTGTHTGTLWSSAGVALATVTFSNETASGWQIANFASPVSITAGATYVVSYLAPSGHYAAAGSYFSNGPADNAPLHGVANSVSVNGVYKYGGGFPVDSYGASNYFVDVLFTVGPPPDTTPPTVATTAPLGGSSSIPLGSTVKATFSEAVQPATITFTLKDPSNATVGATVAYDSATTTATLTPNAALAAGTTYTASVNGAKDTSGNTMASPSTWSFRTAVVAPPPGQCPCSLWTDGTQPGTPASADGASIELGVKFTSDTSGTITGIRFFKGPGNTGVHTGTLWSSTGTLLASATFANETTTGWQTVTFTTPVAINAGTTYVASYSAPNGHYAADSGFFSSSGFDNAPLHALSNNVSANGVYLYGGGFPVNSFGSTNYWVDPVLALAADVTPPTVSTTSPLGGASSVSVATTVQATFSEAVQPATVGFTLVDGSSNAVAGSVTYDAPSKTATFTPSAALSPSTSYTATVSGAKDTAGNTMTAPFGWSFTTAAGGGGSGCPCSLWSDSTTPSVPASADTNAVEIGLKFTADRNGQVTGIRFYKGAGNTGVHTGTLWSQFGVALATASFTNESTTGWQTVTFVSPVAITAGTTYVASYFAPNGHYAVDAGFFSAAGFDRAPLHAVWDGLDRNGVYLYGGGFPSNSFGASNYWVDVVFN